MRTIARSLAGTVAGLLLLGSALVRADAADRCTHDGWGVDGLPLTVTLCVPAEPSAQVTVDETFARNGQTIARTLTLEVVNGVDVTRALDTVALDPLGSPKQLHLTITYRNGRAVVEHALLLPGAVVLK